MSDSNLATLAQIAETSWGVLPSSPVFTAKRFTKSTLNYAKETVISGEIRPDRQVPDMIFVGFSALGGYEFELSAADYSLLFQNVFFTTPLVINLPAVSVVITSGGKNIAGSASTFSALIPGQRIRISGTGGVSDGIFTVVTVAGNGASFTVSEVIANYTGTATFAATVFTNGITRNSMAMELALAPGNYLQFAGMMANTLKLTLEAKKIALGTVEFLGSGATATTSSASVSPYVAASTNPIMNCSANVGRLWTNGAPFPTGIKMLSIEVNNNLRPQPAVGQANLFGVGLGQFKVTGSLQLYFKELATFQQFINHTPTALSAVLTDANGNGISLVLPRIQLDTGKTDIPAVNSDIMEDFTFTATLDPVTGMTMQLTQL